MKINQKLREENARLHNLVREKDNMIISYQSSRLLHEVSLDNNTTHNINILSHNQNTSVPNTHLFNSNPQMNPAEVTRQAQTHSENAVRSEFKSNQPTSEAETQPNHQRQIQSQPTALRSNLNVRLNRVSVNSSQSGHCNTVISPQVPQTVYVRDQIVDILPQFDGSSRRKWIFFEKTYQHLRSKGLSNDELINQFKVSLEGEAYQLVEDLLLTRAESQSIVDTLKEHYGDYDQILLELSREIIDMESLLDRPKHEMMELAIKLKSFVTHAKAYGRTTALNDLFLCDEVVDKLKPEFQDTWGRRIRSSPSLSSNVEELSKFLFEIVRLPSCRRPTTFYSTIADVTVRDNKKHPTFTEEKGTKTNCLCCKGYHGLDKCQVFLNSSLPQRYNLVNGNNICSACLNSSDHFWQTCPSKKRCQLSGCTNYHHRLLHRFVNPS